MGDRPSLACDPPKASCQRPRGPKRRRQDSRQPKLCQQNGNDLVIFYLFFIIFLRQAKAKTPPVVDETEKMREELLRAEAELIQLKKMQVEQQILEAKKSLQKPVTDGSSISSTTPGLTPERKPSSSTSPSSASLSSQTEKTTKKVRCRLSEASYSIPNLINTELINGMFHSDLRFDISPPVIQCLARLILKLDPGLCSHERNTLSDNNVLFPSWTEI